MPDDQEERTSLADLTLPEIALQLARHPSNAVKTIAWLVLAKTAASGRRWTQIALAEIQESTGLSRRTIQRGLDRAEADAIIERRRRPAGQASRADYYALAVPGSTGEPPGIEECAPARAGPYKEQPGEGGSSSGCEVVSESPDRVTKQAHSKQS